MPVCYHARSSEYLHKPLRRSEEKLQKIIKNNLRIKPIISLQQRLWVHSSNLKPHSKTKRNNTWLRYHILDRKERIPGHSSRKWARLSIFPLDKSKDIDIKISRGIIGTCHFEHTRTLQTQHTVLDKKVQQLQQLLEINQP